jgi:hypothetical protein
MNPKKTSTASKPKKTFRDLASTKNPKGGLAKPLKAFDDDGGGGSSGYTPPPPSGSTYHNGFGFKVARTRKLFRAK